MYNKIFMSFTNGVKDWDELEVLNQRLLDNFLPRVEDLIISRGEQKIKTEERLKKKETEVSELITKTLEDINRTLKNNSLPVTISIWQNHYMNYPDDVKLLTYNVLKILMQKRGYEVWDFIKKGSEFTIN